jgi:predicted O-methyltransferase YrrM
MDDAVESYLTELARTEHENPVLVQMEARAAEHGFPIVGRATGRFLELAARAVGARRVMELGSGYGYSAYWFARAVGPDGEVVCTDGDPENARLAEDYLRAAGMWDRVRYRVGDALDGFAKEAGDFDVVYCDVDKDGYPDCWRAARDRIRVGGLWLCDNTIWSGHVATATDKAGPESGVTCLHPRAQPAGGRGHPVRGQHRANPGRRDDGPAHRVAQAHPPVDLSPWCVSS